jgi:hypothetical protein
LGTALASAEIGIFASLAVNPAGVARRWSQLGRQSVLAVVGIGVDHARDHLALAGAVLYALRSKPSD